MFYNWVHLVATVQKPDDSRARIKNVRAFKFCFGAIQSRSCRSPVAAWSSVSTLLESLWWDHIHHSSFIFIFIRSVFDVFGSWATFFCSSEKIAARDNRLRHKMNFFVANFCDKPKLFLAKHDKLLRTHYLSEKWLWGLSTVEGE